MTANAEFDRADLAREIAERTGHDFTVVLDVLKFFPSVLADALVEFEGRAELKDIGVFKLQHRAPRRGVNPNGVPWETPERQSIEFEAAPFLAGIVAERSGLETY